MGLYFFSTKVFLYHHPTLAGFACLVDLRDHSAGLDVVAVEGSHNIRKSAKVVTMSLEGGGVPPVTSFWGQGGGGVSDNFFVISFWG